MTDPRITLPRAPSSLDYSKFIQSIILGRTEKPQGYHELHHIIPRCMGGLDNPDNLIWLTPGEHLQAHRLLVDVFPGEVKLKQALWFMSHLGKKELSLEEYSNLRLKCLDGLRTNLGRDFSEDWRNNIGKAHKGKTISEQHKLSNSQFMLKCMREDPSYKANARRGGETTGKMFWWYKEDQVTRSYSCPGDGWSKGRGPNANQFAAKGGAKSKGKIHWYRITKDGIIERTRSLGCPGKGWIKGCIKG